MLLEPGANNWRTTFRRLRKAALHGPIPHMGVDACHKRFLLIKREGRWREACEDLVEDEGLDIGLSLFLLSEVIEFGQAHLYRGKRGCGLPASSASETSCPGYPEAAG